MLRIAICDDDKIFAGFLEATVISESQSMGILVESEVFSDGKTLLEHIHRGFRYELIFLDIEMTYMNGIDTALRIREIDRSVLLIYVSGYDQYLKNLFEVEPFRFLSKPLDIKKFQRYFYEACQRIRDTEAFFQFTFNKAIYKVPIKDVVYFESRKRLIYVFLANGSIEQFYGKLIDVERSLDVSRKYFLRIHQSFLVNYDYITKMNYESIKIFYNEHEMELNISEDRQKSVRQRLCEVAGGKVVVE